MAAARIELSRRAQRDLRQLRGTPDLHHVLTALDRLAEAAENLDIKAVQGAAPWLRLRVGDLRVLYRALTADELTALPATFAKGFLVARVVNRRDLDRVINSL